MFFISRGLIRNRGSWSILLACLFHIHGVFAEREYEFSLADIEPYVIREKQQTEPVKGLQVEILQLLAKKIGHGIMLYTDPYQTLY